MIVLIAILALTVLLALVFIFFSIKRVIDQDGSLQFAPTDFIAFSFSIAPAMFFTSRLSSETPVHVLGIYAVGWILIIASVIRGHCQSLQLFPKRKGPSGFYFFRIVLFALSGQVLAAGYVFGMSILSAPLLIK